MGKSSPTLALHFPVRTLRESFCVRFIAVMFLITGLIPDSGDSPAPYFMHLALPFFAVKGVHEVGVDKLCPIDSGCAWVLSALWVEPSRFSSPLIDWPHETVGEELATSDHCWLNFMRALHDQATANVTSGSVVFSRKIGNGDGESCEFLAAPCHPGCPYDPN